MLSNFSRIATFTLLTTFIFACGGNIGFPGVYQINIEQGNVVTDEMLDKLKLGLSRRQVLFIMGTPLINDPFNDNRWDYKYSLRNGNQSLNEMSVTLWFDGEKLLKIDRPIEPET